MGFLPWILDGLGSSELGVTAVPLYLGNTMAMVLGSGLGGIAAGLVALLGRDGSPRSALAVGAGTAMAVVVTLAQSRAALHNPTIDNYSTDNRVLTGLSVVTVVVTLVGVVWGLLALTGPVGQGIALTGVSGALPLWLTGVLTVIVVSSWTDYAFVSDLARWLGAAVLVAALVRIGVAPAARFLGWPVAIVLAWLVAPTLAAAGYAEQLLRPGLPSEMVGETVSAASQVWRMSAALDARPLTSWIVAVIVAAALSWYLGRGSRADEQPDRDATEPVGPTLP